MDKQMIEEIAKLIKPIIVSSSLYCDCNENQRQRAKEEVKKQQIKNATALYNAGYGDLRAFAGKLKDKAIRQQEFVGELAIGDIEYVKVKDIDETLKEFLGE